MKFLWGILLSACPSFRHSVNISRFLLNNLCSFCHIWIKFAQHLRIVVLHIHFGADPFSVSVASEA